MDFIESHPTFHALYEVVYQCLIPILHNQYPTLCRKKENKDGTFLSLILQNMERLIIMNVLDLFQQEGYTIGSIIHDGFLVKKSNLDLDATFERVEAVINEKYCRL